MVKGPNTPLYKILIDDLKRQIDTGVYKIGDLLPSENDLCRRYDTTRPTVRQALGELTRIGYITRRHGKGSIVSEPKGGLGILSLKGTTAGVGKKNLKTIIDTEPKITTWPEEFFFELSTAQQEAGCIYFTRVRYVDGLPTLYEETYITNLGLPGFSQHNLEKNSLFDTLKMHYDIEVKEGEQKFWAIASTAMLSNLLEVEPERPLLHMKRGIHTNRTDLKIYSFLYCNTQKYFIQDYF